MHEGGGRGRRSFTAGRAMRWLVVTALAFSFGGCASPEAKRTRGGGPGADPGNRGAEVAVHGRVDPFHGTPRKLPVAASSSRPVATSGEVNAR
ncbi:uncharacterized protein CMC5_059630 [Chondromyces crocatus]|uniref:Uncharacterized protein n=1 Tax=Chondromyces crocatus TaxID=52 RepID=A0A0K1EM77_CHOCO|nr:uncharacterized protein CMC5_059630 [Chondromyces crocatus]